MATKITPDMFSLRSLRVITDQLKLETLEQVAELSAWDLRQHPNFGLKSLKEVNEVLEQHGLSLRAKPAPLKLAWDPLETKPIEQPWKPEYLDMLRGLRRIAEFPLAETTSPDSAAVYMRAVARHILRSGKES